jgi:hypothetical protein
MKKTAKIILSGIVLLSVSSVILNADASKGQRLYLKKLKSVCGINGAKMAAKHSSAQWEKLHNENKIADEIRKECPKVKDSSLKEKFMIHYYDFFKMYSNDSGNIPSC